MLEQEKEFLEFLHSSPDITPCRWIDNYCDLLITAVGDTSDLIYYYVYDLNFGENYKEGVCVDSKGNPIPLKTYEDLWNAIQRSKEDIYDA